MAKLGFVTLVGAGPGDLALMTLGGARALQLSEVVLYDHLVGSEVLGMIPADALQIDVGKRSGNHTMPQAQINELILQHALAGRRVVRLKGGDPYLFGRGAEELELLNEHEIPYRVIPGVTSAIAAPAYAGIPVTHRAHSSSVHIITGHARGDGALTIDYEALVRLRGTLVFLMGVTALSEISAGLIQAGMREDTPAALIHCGTWPEQRKLVATVCDIASRARLEGITAPATLVVGSVCLLGEAFDFTRHLPLWGYRFVAASAGSGEKLAMRLRDMGAAVDVCTCVKTRPASIDTARLAYYRWIALTSAQGVDAMFEAMLHDGVDVRALGGVRFAAVGRETARALESRGILVEYMPDVFDGAHLGEGLSSRVLQGERMLLLRAREAAPGLAEALARHGVGFDEMVAYDTVDADIDATGIRNALTQGRYHAVTFTSASAVDAFARRVSGVDWTALRAVCIGETTAARARAYGMTALVSRTCSIDGMVELIASEGGTWT